ncbi:hypothetical protein [Mycolicibacterium farcinogenes]|uniref:hypothetical protein n=1 Tax=Mycolicibacterium farcinogenes TaxID=1802 RepID=UPI0021AD9D4B|nr:hypothetical protein [Mycolicibacterium farcinogenes]
MADALEIPRRSVGSEFAAEIVTAAAPELDMSATALDQAIWRFQRGLSSRPAYSAGRIPSTSHLPGTASNNSPQLPALAGAPMGKRIRHFRLD